jgi:hypothetical protein
MDQPGMETAEKDNVITLTINRMLNESENDLLMKRMKEMERQLSMKIVVIPFSMDVAEGES